MAHAESTRNYLADAAEKRRWGLGTQGRVAHQKLTGTGSPLARVRRPSPLFSVSSSMEFGILSIVVSVVVAVLIALPIMGWLSRKNHFQVDGRVCPQIPSSELRCLVDQLK